MSADETSHQSECIEWSQLSWLALAMLLSMGMWFASTVIPPPIATNAWSTNTVTWMSTSIQIGFIVGTFISAYFNLPDRFSSRLLRIGVRDQLFLI